MIAMYVHHHGSGHMHRARTIAREIDDEVVILSSAPGADIPLPLDVGEDAGPTPAALHWAPRNCDGLTQRMAIIARFIAERGPRAFYVDVSVEVCVFVRLMGVPVVTLRMPGDRSDAPHQLGYAMADAVIAAWPDWVPTEPGVIAVGGISRFAAPAPVARTGPPVALIGAGGDGFSSFKAGTVVLRREPDPMRFLATTPLVTAGAGQNSVADIAVAGAPAVIIAQPRPFGEQQATAEVLGELAVVADEPIDTPEVRAEAARKAKNWPLWQTDGAAARAAAIIEEVAA